MAVMTEAHKLCTSCGERKPRVDFNKARSTRDGLHGHCKPCRAARNRAAYNPVLQRDKNLRSHYGITAADYDAMIWLQDNLCAVCQKTLPDSGVTGAHVDHDHSSGKVRGVLCHDCNLGLGRFGDDPVALRRAAAYLELG